ncbi:uncharacterized protein CEXT_398501 [Caerostris extrusa]|uniref:Uncharacterized protein n=1 Tax=Caerostris extrusa TaxID=172846 RepID=A0AAV4RPV9_CAEEX|nr:uncharacterized protein CEXT_398501 [Caerostris extrusa]
MDNVCIDKNARIFSKSLSSIPRLHRQRDIPHDLEHYPDQEELNFCRVDPERLPSGIAGVSLGTIIGAVRQLFLTIIERTTETLAPTDLIRFYIQDDHLDHPISTTIMPVSDLTIEKILTEILKVLQSKKSIHLTVVLR